MSIITACKMIPMMQLRISYRTEVFFPQHTQRSHGVGLSIINNFLKALHKFFDFDDSFHETSVFSLSTVIFTLQFYYYTFLFQHLAYMSFYDNYQCTRIIRSVFSRNPEANNMHSDMRRGIKSSTTLQNVIRSGSINYMCLRAE